MEGDTGSYIETGILGYLPADRTPFYGFFMRYTSMWTSLWFTIFAQSLILAALLLKYIRRLQGRVLPFATTLFTVIPVVAFTCVSWMSSCLMPDVFTAVLLLAVLLYLSEKAVNAAWTIAYTLIIFAVVIIHNSHFLILALFAGCMLLWALIKKHRMLARRCILLICIAVLSWATMCTINAANGNGFTYSRGSHVFMMGRLAEAGILSAYLDDHCGKEPLKLCSYRDQIPAYSWDFIWDDQSPLYKTGGWVANKQEYEHIIHGVFTTPAYLKMFARNAATGTLRQLFQVRVPDKIGPQGYQSAPWWMMGKYFQDEEKEYMTSRQNAAGLHGGDANLIYYTWFILSSLLVLYCSKQLNSAQLFIYGGVLLFFVINAFVTATFSTVLFRYQERIFWILPATNGILLVNLWLKKMAAGTGERAGTTFE